jgi:hypothetical protein
MHLYSGMSDEFIRDATYNRVAEQMKDTFYRHYGFTVSDSELAAWRNSLRAFSQVLQESALGDLGVVVEYQLPLTSKRLDCLVCGDDAGGNSHAVVVELKQWDRCAPAFGEKLVTTYVGGAEREVLHPAVQVQQYHLYLSDMHTAFYEDPSPIALNSCAYLHNYFPVEDDFLFNSSFAGVINKHPVFTGKDVDPLIGFLQQRLGGGNGEPVRDRIERSKLRPSKKLMQHVAQVIRGNPQYVLLDEQLVVYETVLACARHGVKDRKKYAIIVKGGPGTGKSVIAINLMADLLSQSHNAHYATGSRAFTSTLREIIGMRGSVQFKYFNSYMSADPNSVDIVICDEAHRIRLTSNDRYTPKVKKASKPQIDELLDVSKVAVFFIDDHQSVRPDEIGSVSYIRDAASRAGCELREYQLEAQFRCAGSEAFVNWVSNTLGIASTANTIWEGDAAFDFQIVETPLKLDLMIRKKLKEEYSARLVAGFCWPWSDPTPEGTLVDDIQIGDFRRPWNLKPTAKRGVKGVPEAALWAYRPGGEGQVGCIYTAQGFEFDYVGVIFGTDLVYDPVDKSWKGNPGQSYDTVVKRSKQVPFVDLVRNAYRVLLSRGMKGCYVCFLDKNTEDYVRSRTNGQQAASLQG